MQDQLNKYCIIDFKGEGTFECFEVCNELKFIRLLKRNVYAIPTEINIKSYTKEQLIGLINLGKAKIKVGSPQIL